MGLKIRKLYYSISEVSERTSLKAYVLRYWEGEFPELRPSKNRAGNRIYREHDIDIILHIKKLLYQDKFTIEGAKNRLKDRHQEPEKQDEPTVQTIDAEEPSPKAMVVEDIRTGLQDIIGLLDG